MLDVSVMVNHTNRLLKIIDFFYAIVKPPVKKSKCCVMLSYKKTRH
jgi:hypothetical protein